MAAIELQSRPHLKAWIRTRGLESASGHAWKPEEQPEQTTQAGLPQGPGQPLPRQGAGQVAVCP